MSPSFDNSFATLPGRFYVRQSPVPVSRPDLVRVNSGLAAMLGIDENWLESEAGIATLGGNRVPEGAEPLAMVYAGHQFGAWNPRLGDGRAILLGEVVGTDGERYDIQLKGSGLTPFSRNGDGRAPLGPVLREYLVSEAMAALGIATTRALAAVTTGETVYREEPLPGGVLARVAKSHIRIGTLQYFSATGDTEGLGLLVDHVVARHFAAAAGHDIPALALYEQVVRRQAELVAHWQSTGFIHGVMNTDNMLLSGETIDYGPCAFMDHYDPAAVYSYIDHGGRYAFRNQPAIAHWNLACLGEALLPLLGEEREQAAGLAQEVLDRFPGLYENAYLARMRQKLGLKQEQEGDRALIDDFLELLAENSCDYTLAFRCLGGPSRETGMLHSVFRFPDSFGGWLDRWRRRCSDEAATATELEDRLSAVNPAVIPRNHLVEEAIRRGYEGDFSLFHHLCERFSRPFEWPEDDISLVTPPLPDQVVTQTFCGT